MTILVIKVAIDVDPTLEDPNEVAESLLLDYEGGTQDYCGEKPTFVAAEWEN